jgi:DNA-binding response OmpR family regulator
MKTILIVEDDVMLRNELSKFLQSNNYHVEVINDFSNTINDILSTNCDLVLLDLNLPEVDGHTICKEIRKVSEVPIVVVTSKDTEIDELIAINYGADDFVTKPYNAQILLARISRIFKRSSKTNAIKYQDLTVDLTKSLVFNNEKSIEFSRNEIRVISYLLSMQGTIVSRDQLIDHLWEHDHFVDDNTLTVNINRVRTKLKELGYTNVIETRRGQGYIIL